MASDLQQFALYYPGSQCRPSWIKNRLLMFDGVALFTSRELDYPDEVFRRENAFERELGAELLARRKIRILPATKVVTAEMGEKFVERMIDIFAEGTLDRLKPVPIDQFRPIHIAKLGYGSASELAEIVYEALKERRFIEPSPEDRFQVRVHPRVQVLVSMLYTQLLQPLGHEFGMEFLPTTDKDEAQLGLTALLSEPTRPSAANVVALDMEAVGLDLRPVDLDAILLWRQYMRDEYYEYVRSVRRFVDEAGTLRANHLERELEARRTSIERQAKSLRIQARDRWATPLKSAAVIGLGVAGATWQWHQGDSLGSLINIGLTAAGASLPWMSETADKVGAFSFLFSAHQAAQRAAQGLQ